MTAKVAWITYWVIAFVIAPIVFRRRFSRWPFVVRLPRDTYTMVEYSYGLLLVVFTVALLTGSNASGISLPGGLGVIVCASGLQAWAEWAMGPNYRIGQDPDDQSRSHVSRGPFRFVRHPIYIGLVLIAFGQMLLMGLDRRSLTLLVGTMFYAVVQGRAETRHWAVRRKSR